MNQTNLSTSGLHKFQDECLTLLQGMVSADKVVSYIVDKHSRPICYKNHHIQPPMHQAYINDFYKFDPLHPSNFKDDTTACVVKMNDLVSVNHRSHHPYYSDFLRPWGVQDIVELFFHADDKLVAGAALFFSQEQGELKSDDIKKIEHLHRYIEFSLEQYYSSSMSNDFESFCAQYGLTAKEKDVIIQVLEGLPNKSIASNLCCSLATIKTHLQHIFQKMDVNSKAEVTNLVYRSGCSI